MSATDTNIEAIYPLTPVQDGILFHTLYAPDAPLYIQQYTCLIHGTLDESAFVEAWQLVIDRHQSLRSLLTWEGRDRPLQIVRRRVAPEWLRQDWTQSSPGEQAQRLEELLAADRRRGFSLDVAPLMRFTLLRLDDSTYRFVWTHHHIVIDGWSMGVVLDEVFRIYAAHIADEQPELPPAAPYRDYVRWLKAFDDGGAESYWRSELADVGAATPLGMGEAGDRVWAENHAEAVRQLDANLTARLTEFARGNGVTLNTLLRAAWATVLSRYSGGDDVVFGATFSGRPPDLDGALEMVGLFINTLPVRVQIRADQPVGEWLRDIHRRQVDMSPYESTPLATVQGWSQIGGGRPLFESLLVFENVPLPRIGSDALSISDVRYLQRSNYPLAILVMPGEQLELIVIYDSDRFQADSIDRVLGQIVTILEGIIADAAGRVGALPFFPAHELEQIVRTWNATTADYPRDRPVHDLIADAAAATPGAVAVADSAHSLTYGEIMERASAITAELTALGIGANDRVGINLDRSAAMVAAIVGVLQAGAAYVPLDPGLPAARLSLLLEDTSARAILTANGDDTVAAGWNGPTIRIGDDGSPPPKSPPATDAPAPTVTAEDLAYVLYTSGSTGRPKGVAVTHDNLVASTYARLVEYGDPVDTFLLLSPFIFDSSVAGLFSSLTQGGTLVLPAPRMEQDVQHLGQLIAAHQVTHTLALPTVYGLLLELVDPNLLRSLRLVMVAGEPCPPSLVERHAATLPATTLVNEYGPTEATVWCTVHRLHPGGDPPSRRVPIGRPIANAQAYILDRNDRPVPVGVPGELCIAGRGVALGYLDQPELTAERFVTIELPLVGATRLYRSGDVARFLPDGTIDLLGRVDHQVKIRGQRIELGEIESVLESHPAVRSAVVVLHNSEASGPNLYGYVAAPTDDAGLGIELRDYLGAQLPQAMVPRIIMVLDELPRGATGKIDRAALPEPSLPEELPETDYVAPRNPIEEELAAIWSTVLGVETVSVTDNFFELGGDSILSIRVIARAHQAGVSITPKQFFESPTVAGLASQLGQQ